MGCKGYLVLCMEKSKKPDLNERLADFSVQVVLLAEKLPNTTFGKHMKDQLIRSSTSATLNYGEARGAESRKDFIHKMKICLKELRETYNSLLILLKYEEKNGRRGSEIPALLTENNELISIFVASVKTAVNKERTAIP